MEPTTSIALESDTPPNLRTPSPDPLEVAPESGDPIAALLGQVLRPRTLGSLLITALIGYVVARRVLSGEFGEIWLRLREANLDLLAVAVIAFYAALFVRTLRWRLLLWNVGYHKADGYRLPALPGLYRIVVLAAFANSITIGQIGDAIRGYFLKRRVPGVSFTTTAGTIVAERLFDVVVLLALLSGSALVAFKGDLPAVATQSLTVGVVVASVGAIGMLAFYRFGHVIRRLLPQRLHPMYERLERGVVCSFQHVPQLLSYSVAGWLLEGTTLYFAGAAIGASLSISDALVVAMLASLLGVASITPGGMGVTEAGIVLILRPLGVDPATAAAIAVLNRVINYWSVTLVGSILYALGGPG